MKKALLIVLFALSVNAEFNLQFIGDSLKNDEAQGQEFCTSKYCVGDSQILFYAASQNSSVHPCIDFKEFSMGTLIKYRALHERYFAIGLLQDTQKYHEERLRKQLAKKVDEKSDVRVFKVMKNFFAKCVSSKNVRKNGKKEIIEYLKSLGGSPYLNGDSWDPTQFNISKILQLEPYYGVLTLLDNEFKSWSDPDGWNKSHAIPSLVKEGIYSYEDPERLSYDHYKDMLIEMNELHLANQTFREDSEVEIGKAVERLAAFEKILRKHKGQSDDKEIIKIKELINLTPSLEIDWLQIINDQLLNSVKVTEDDDILVIDPQTLKSLSSSLDTIDKGLLADAFVLKFLYANRFLAIVYPFDKRDEAYSSNTRAKQRWEQCLNFVNTNMRPGLEVMLASSKELDVTKLEIFVKGAIQDFVDKVKTLNETILSAEVREKVIIKLGLIDLLSGLFAHNFTENNLDDYYEELSLKGDENLVESALEIQRFHRRIDNDYKYLFTTNSKSSLDSASQSDEISYNTLNDEFRVSAVWTYYPWYHSERPKFFNQATLYLDVIAAVKAQIERYIGNVLWADAIVFYDALDVFKFAYENYVEWEAKGGKDLLLGANKLTNRQLFWLALARSRYRKQKAQPGIEGNDYDRTFFFFKNKFEPLETYDSFKDAYHCEKSAPVTTPAADSASTPAADSASTPAADSTSTPAASTSTPAADPTTTPALIEKKKEESSSFFSFLSNLG